MEPAEIEWKNVVSHYELDEVYERINAPKWIDFSVPDAAVDDVAWFCRPDCRHPITYEDFDRWNPSPKVKLLRSDSDANRDGERNNNQRDANLKRRVGIVSVFPWPSKPTLNSRRAREDLENQNPNMEATPLTMKGKKIAVAAKKEAIKSSAEKKVVVDEEELGATQRKRSPPQPRLKSTFSARNLFTGRDILSQISEFCLELKKLATGKDTAAIEEEKKGKMKKTLEEEGKAASKEIMEEKKAPISTIKTGSLKKKCELTVKFDGSGEKKNKILKEARAYPPTPQRFPSPSSHLPQLKSSKASENSNSSSSSSSSSHLCKISKSKIPERGVLMELEQRREEKKIQMIPKNEECNTASVLSEAEGSTVDLFWFLKPCTYLS